RGRYLAGGLANNEVRDHRSPGQSTVANTLSFRTASRGRDARCRLGYTCFILRTPHADTRYGNAVPARRKARNLVNAARSCYGWDTAKPARDSPELARARDSGQLPDSAFMGSFK